MENKDQSRIDPRLDTQEVTDSSSVEPTTNPFETIGQTPAWRDGWEGDPLYPREKPARFASSVPDGSRRKHKTRPILIEGDVARLTLTKGQVAIIDAVDVPLVQNVNWHAMPSQSGGYYAAGRIDGRAQTLHRYLFGLGPGNKITPDHKDRDGLNCRRSNLRPANGSQQRANTRKQITASTSPYKGVSIEKNGRYRSFIANGKPRSLGTFGSAEAAALAYNVAALEAFGEFALLNSIPNPESVDMTRWKRGKKSA